MPDDRCVEDDATARPGGPRTSGWVFALVVGLVGLVALAGLVGTPGDEQQVDYAQLLVRVRSDRVLRVELHQDSGKIEGVTTSGREFTTQGPPGGIPDSDLELLDDHDVRRTYAKESSNVLGSLLVYLLPVLLLIGFFVWMSRRTTQQMTSATAFTSGRARVHRSERSTTTFDDIAGYEAVKQEIQEVVAFLRDATEFRALGAKVPKGILLVGPPGTGKTLFAKAIAGEAGVPFLSITGSEFLEMFVGVGAARVRDVFATARRETPSILFVDEIDAIGRKRGTGLGGGHDEREQTLNQLLAEMDGFESTEGIIVLAATNRPDVLDPALLRAGRFDRQVLIPLPTADEREAILRVHSHGKRIGPDVDLDLLARGTPGMSGAELANLLNEAALLAARRHGTEITEADVEGARDRILIGIRRSSLALSEEEKRIVAYHEAGHTVLADLLPGADPVHKVTILPTGMALGVTEQVPVGERQLHRRDHLEDRIAVAFGGRAAEELVFGTCSTGAQDDLVTATGLAKRMVREWGMSDRLRHMAWGSQGPVFLGEDLTRMHDYSDHTAQVIDEETERILDEQAGRAAAALAMHRAELDAIAAALLERETLSAEEVAAAIAGVGAADDLLTA
jgi:cell division protease FtsH